MRVEGRKQQAHESNSHRQALDNLHEFGGLQHGSNQLHHQVPRICVNDYIRIKMGAQKTKDRAQRWKVRIICQRDRNIVAKSAQRQGTKRTDQGFEQKFTASLHI